MKRVYLTGHSNFGNRGCEAIVRSTVAELRRHLDQVEVFVPSSNVELDRLQWPEAESTGVRFVNEPPPWYARYWIHLQRLPISMLKSAGWPFAFPRSLKELLLDMDVVLSVGGDNYSLDYRLPSFLMGLDGVAMDLGIPVILWGASVGPFEGELDFKPIIRNHLSRMSLITVRESFSLAYLENELELSNIARMPDPAFTLKAEKINDFSFWPQEGRAGVLGLNVSPLIERYRANSDSQGVLLDEVANFVRQVVERLDLSVLLIPHVIPLDGRTENSDVHYMKRIVALTGPMNGRVGIPDQQLNAAQLKYVISKCRFFIGARTHSTIAALSSIVPTISIAYSVKARGINKDLFGHTDYVLETAKVSTKTLLEVLLRLQLNEAEIREELGRKVPVWQREVADGLKGLQTALR